MNLPGQILSQYGEVIKIAENELRLESGDVVRRMYFRGSTAGFRRRGWTWRSCRSRG